MNFLIAVKNEMRKKREFLYVNNDGQIQKEN